MFALSGPNGEAIVEFVPGFGGGRWGVDVQLHFQLLGANLREATDAVLTRVEAGRDIPFMSMEFCGALPAGNNSWQRCGRALAMAEAALPFYYFAEIGGQELDENRVPKASRFPNPVVPFAYYCLNKAAGGYVEPVFLPSPSITPPVREAFLRCFGEDDVTPLMRGAFDGTSRPVGDASLLEKTINLVGALSSKRRRTTGLDAAEWKELAGLMDGRARAHWFSRRGLKWSKKVSIPTTPSFRDLLRVFEGAAYAVGTTDVPICVVSEDKRDELTSSMRRIYGSRLSQEFSEWMRGAKLPLVAVWLAGFKPHGDDSRPDRGLVALARMLFERGSADLLPIIYGPAKPAALSIMESSPMQLAESNGLWEAVLKLGEAVLVDSATGRRLASFGFVLERASQGKVSERSFVLNPVPDWGEQDVDTLLHMLVFHSDFQGVFEGMCNPPGGDWSGLSVLSKDRKVEHRWTSLPRVSGAGSKRPDHVAQVLEDDGDVLLVIESKDSPRSLEPRIGRRLEKYVKHLTGRPPNIERERARMSWRPASGRAENAIKRVVSVSAVRGSDPTVLRETLSRGGTAAVVGFDFGDGANPVRAAVLTLADEGWIGTLLEELGKSFPGRLEVEVD